MGLFFTLLYVLTAFLAPQTLFGGLADYHIEVIIALIALVFSLFSAQGSGLMRMPQTYGIIGLSFCVIFSLLFVGLVRQAPSTLLDFLPNSLAFFFVYLNCKKKIHLKLLLLVLLFAAIFTVFRGFLAIHTGDFRSPYLLSQGIAEGTSILRIRGLSFLNDPNDLSQFFVGLIPCLFLFWGKGKSFSNFFLVLLPVTILLCGMFLSHSRGGMVALMIAAIVAGRRKIGLLPAAITGALLFVGLSAIGWSGGREVNAAQGEDRMEAWSTGLQIIRAHPVFGVGYRRFTEYYTLTAHNTVIVCAAELGLVGLFFLMMIIFPSMHDAFVGSGDAKRKRDAKLAAENKHPVYRDTSATTTSTPVPDLLYADAALATPAGNRVSMARAGLIKPVRSGSTASAASGLKAQPGGGAFSLPNPMGDDEEISVEELQRMSSLVMISLAGFFTAGWFLSRPYSMTLYVITGIAAVVYRMGRERGTVPEPMPLLRAAKLSTVTSAILIMIVYAIIRLQHAGPK